MVARFGFKEKSEAYTKKELKRQRKMSQDENWTTEQLLEALAQSAPASDGAIKVELVEGTDPGILVTMT